MNDHSLYIHPLKRNGTAQSDRFPEALRDGYVKIEERNILDLIQQSASYSTYTRFFQDNTAANTSATWQPFFEEIYDFTQQKCIINSIDDLAARADTSPHIALFIAFLQLLQISNENLNEFTERHLLFFYETVLQLKRKAAKPSQAIVFGEVAKNTDEVSVIAGSRLKAGKDARGNEIFFKVKKDSLINKATVAEIKNICFGADKITKRIQSDSLDGSGKPLVDPPKSWDAFGNTADELAKTGFAFSSPLFLLPEGKRVIGLNTGTMIQLKDFDVYISTKNGFSQVTAIDNNNLVLDPSFPAVTNFDANIHTGNFNTIHPVLKFELKENAANRYRDNWFAVPDVKFAITVTGIKNLRLRNELGEIDATKPFNPFGTRPRTGISELLVGYPLVFNKYCKTVNINNTTGNPKREYLANKTWTASMNTSAPIDPVFDETFSISTQGNYMKLVYAGNDFSLANKIQSVPGSNNITTVTLLNETPPSWKNISLDYTQAFSTVADAEIVQTFHIHPFGVESKKYFDTLLPQYTEESYLLIGLADAGIGQSFSIHFQLYEDSGNPDVPLPAIKWNVLQQNKIIPLTGPEIIQDTTLGLSQSGIIRFAPKGNDYWVNSILAGNLLWLIATCENAHEAIPKFISIRPQAIDTVFDGKENVDIAAGTISKFEMPTGTIKKIEQPYASYGGYGPENTMQFTTRTSEYLRHKGCAISIFDYERLILEAFPDIYKVKCITHSNSASFDQPGKVLILVIPVIRKENTQNRLQPKVSIGILAQVKQFLERRISPFVSVEVINPVYQSIKAEVHVSYHASYPDKKFYNDVLNKKLLSFFAPWLQNGAQINFNAEIYLSAIINFIEEQEFVNFITGCKIYSNGIEVSGSVKPGSEKAILTSVENHIIENQDLC